MALPLQQMAAPFKQREHDMSFNDDDFYVINLWTMTVSKHVGCKAGWKPEPLVGQIVVKGMTAKYMNLN